MPSAAAADGPSEDYLARCRQRMSDIDSLPPELRQLVHEHGWTIIKAFLDHGIRRPKTIAHIIARVREGSTAYGNGTRGEHMKQATVPLPPTDEMVDASMAAVVPLSAGGALMTKREKHRRRLEAAIRAGATR